MWASATLYSNGGNEYIELTPQRVRGARMECALRCQVRNWEADELSFVTFAADSIGLSVSSVLQLCDDLAVWLDSSEVGIKAFTGDYSLGFAPRFTLHIYFEDRAHYVTSTDKPCVTIFFSYSTTRLQFGFVTDQSCLGLFAQALRSWRKAAPT